MVEFIIGPATSGKTTTCYNQIREALGSGGYHELFMLVPEQFNLQVQVELAKLLHPGLLRVEVIGFKKLAEKIAGELGGSKEPIIDDLERMMILKKVIDEHKDELVYFKKAYSSDGFIDHMNRLLTLFEQNHVDEAMIHTLSEEATDVFKCKLQDMMSIKKWFETYIADKFMTVEKTMEHLAHTIHQSHLVDRSMIWVDGFYGFTLPQIQILGELMEKTTKLVITLPMDKVYTKEEYIYGSNPFYDSIRQFQKLVGLCEERNVSYHISFMEREEENETPFGYLKSQYLKTYNKRYEKEQTNIHVTTSGTKEEEVEKVAQLIKSLVRDEGYRYSDIALLVGDIDSYHSTFSSLFKEYEIPLFIDNKRSIHTNGLVAVINSTLEILTNKWSYKNMMSLLRLHMFDLTKDEIDCLENYILEHGIQGEKRWEIPWERKSSNVELEEINYMRAKIVGIVQGFEANIKAYKDKRGRLSVRDMTIALYGFLESIHAYHTIQLRSAYYEKTGEVALFQENNQIWGQVMDTLERLVDLLGEERVSVKTYKNILKTSFGYVRMGIIPPSQDQVMVGTIDRSRLPDTKALFILGVNEGVIPKTDETTPLFSEMDKLTLTHITQTKGGQLNRLNDVLVNNPLTASQFLVYLALSKPSDKLFVSAVLRDENGKSLRPSSTYYKMKKMFGQTELVETDALAPIHDAKPTMTYIGKKLKDYLEGKPDEEIDPLWKDTMSWYMKDEKWGQEIRQLAKDFTYTNQQHYLHPENAKKLYPEGIVSSISKIETYRQCPCCYFVRYGIKASERKIFQWDARDLGTLFHAALEQYPRELEAREKKWTEVNETEMNECVEAAVEKSVNQTSYKGQQDGKIRYTLNKVIKMTKRAVRALTYHLSQGDFEPHDYEVTFGAEEFPPIEIVLENGQKMLLKGQIDRVDLYVEDEAGTSYVKIIDYKSGNKNFNLLEVYYSLQLQLLLYLDAYMRQNPKYKVGGMFYFHIDSKKIDYELGMKEEEISQKQMGQFKLSGLVLSDPELVKHMEHSGEGQIIPAKLKKGGKELSATSSAATEKQFDLLRDYMTEQIRQIGKDMLDGRISARPYRLGEKDGCSFCKYHTICQFEQGTKDNEYDTLQSLKKAAIWENLEGNGKEEA